jgi:cytochrome c-type biogenesis protein CcmH
MAIWMIFALMAGAALMAVLWPLSRRPPTADSPDQDTRFYNDQLAEIERDLGRGLISVAEAEAARTEAARRLLRASQTGAAAADAFGEPALRRRRAASAIALSTVPLLALAIYGAYGSPHLSSQPLGARVQSDPQQLDFASAVARIEAHLAQQPADGRGWEVIAPVYLRSGRIEDAVKAYGNAMRLLGEDASRLSNYGEALVAAGEGVVSVEARQAFDRALQHDPALPKPRFYLARAAEQDGDREAARSHYDAILSSSAADAPWVPLVTESLARLSTEGAAMAVASASADGRRAAIRGMVEGLAQRLAASGGTAEEWGRLVRSYAVLGERDKASATLKSARAALVQDEAGLGRLEALAQELALNTAAATR